MAVCPPLPAGCDQDGSGNGRRRLIEWSTVRRYSGAADAALDRIGTVIWPEAAFHIEAAKEKIKSEAGEAFFQEHYSSGRQLSFTETIQLTSEAFDELTAH